MASVAPDPKQNVGDDLVEAFHELAAYFRGEAIVESYEIADEKREPAKVVEGKYQVSPTKII